MTEKSVLIDVGRDFARLPFGRHPTDGPNSGTRFREEFLIPALERSEKITVILDNAKGLGSSFLDESFAGLAKRKGWQSTDFIRRVRIVSERDPTLIQDVIDYVKESVG